MSWFPAREYSIIPWGDRIFTVTNQLRRSSMRIKREKTRVRQEKEREREKKSGSIDHLAAGNARD